jgi:hypothetical protein
MMTGWRELERQEQAGKPADHNDAAPPAAWFR